jgi:hypothetical protein
MSQHLFNKISLEKGADQDALQVAGFRSRE